MEILFRGWSKGGKQWVNGDLNHIDGKVYVFDRSENAPLNSPDWFEVEPESVGMFTGLLDKNGKKIFGAVGARGGDVLKHSYNEALFNWEVVFEHGCFGIKNIGVDAYRGDFFPINTNSFFCDREIISSQFESK